MTESVETHLPGGQLQHGLHARFWLIGPDKGNWIGIGRVRLLQAIDETGSIRQAAKRLGMSYKRAWSLVQAMNMLGPYPMVERATGGKKGGGAFLTEYGRQTLMLYARLEAQMRQCAATLEEDIRAWQQGALKE